MPALWTYAPQGGFSFRMRAILVTFRRKSPGKGFSLKGDLTRDKLRLAVKFMKFSEAFNTTLEHFNLSARSVAREAGVRESTLSEFRRGLKEIHTDNLERLIQALPMEAKQYLFCRVLMGQMDNQGMATLLSAIAHHLKEDNSQKHRVSQPEPVLSLK